QRRQMLRFRRLHFESTDLVLFFSNLDLASILGGLGHGGVDRRQRIFHKPQRLGQRQRTAERQTDESLQVQTRLLRLGLCLGQSDLLLGQTRLSTNDVNSSRYSRIALILRELE